MGNALVARDSELDELLALVRQGAGVVLCGEAGIGKTAVATAIAARVAADGDVVERVVATAAARPMPFGALGPLLPEDLTSLHPALVLGAIVRRLRDLAGRRAPLVIIDDAQFLDGQSAATVLGLATSGAARLFVTLRSGETEHDAIRALWKDGVIPRIDMAPFDRAASREFLERHLGGDVAATTAELLWQHTRGNALYLTELVRHAQRNGDLRDDGGVWVWSGDVTVPTRLADLLEQRFDGLSPSARDVLGALVLGEPLPLDTLSEVVPDEGIAEVETHDLVVASEQDGSVQYRFGHPLLAAVAARRLTPSRRRHLARELIAASGENIDVVRRATWHVEAGVAADVDLLLGGARAVLLTNPAFARRLAERALSADDGPEAALTLADANAELGDVAAARSAQEVAITRVRDDRDRLSVILNQASLTTFSERRPDLALEAVAAARQQMPEACHADLDSCASLLTAFSSQPAKARAIAEDVLAANPPRPAVMRASSARVSALALMDEPVEAVRAADELLAYVGAGPASPYAQGVAHLMALFAYLTRADPGTAPSTDPSAGRWPLPPSVADVDRRLEAVAFPLYSGARRLFEGHLGLAIPSLREAVAQQHVGEGLLRSEAVACLTVALASAGQVAEAEQVLACDMPDRLAIYSGLRPWAMGALAAAQGRPEATDLAFEAADEARRAGATISVVAYLGDAARYGAARQAAEQLDSVGQSFRSPFTVARALSIRALASGDGKALLEAAEAHAEYGLVGPALSLAERATNALGRGPSAVLDRARSLTAELRRHLGRADIGPVAPVTLTRRELEVARLAARGMTDRDIADLLVVSVRTVESHLASAYRKLDISSRQELRGALPDVG
jgi:DNA-binding CsgD family transcriptional regulator